MTTPTLMLVAQLTTAVSILPGLSLQQAKAPSRPQQTWCNLAAHVARMQPVAMQDDPVFRRPAPIAREKLQAVAAMFDVAKNNKRDKALATRQLAALLRTPDGPALARIALQANNPMLNLVAQVHGLQLARQHPRLASFAGQHVRHKDPKIAASAVKMMLASRCDITASYAMDGLLHPALSVREAVAEAVLAASTSAVDIGLVDRLLEHVLKAEKDGIFAARVVRRIGQLGWLGAAGQLQQAVSRPSTPKLVALEARVALAKIAGATAPKSIRSLLASKSAWDRVCAVRIAAAGMTRRGVEAAQWLRPLLSDHRPCKDPLGGQRTWLVSEAAKLARTHLLMLPRK